MRMIRFMGCLIFCGLAVIASMAPAGAADGECPKQKLDFPPGLSEFNLSFENIWKYATGLPGRVIVEHREVTVVEVASQCATYAFTKEAHFAHPSVLWRYIILKDKQIDVGSRGFGFGAKAPFEKWMGGVPALNRQMRDALRRRHQR